ncbi:MAG TPA: tetratricopeptide repeat protein [Phycisphaerae bacterium]|nr:tetratricopeptide repeat protein [Phycisphaerae bacterium]
MSARNFRALFDDAARLWAAGQRQQAEPLLREVLALRPRHPEALHLLGILCVQSGRLDEGVSHLQTAIALKPYFVEAQANLGAALLACFRPADAAPLLRQVLLLKPDHVPSISNLARALEMLGQPDEAITTYRRALQLKPDSVETLYRLAGALHAQGTGPDIDAAIDACAKAVALAPAFLDARNGLANLLRDVGRSAEALELYRGIAAGNPEYVEAHSNILTILNAMPAIEPAALLHEHQQWARRHADPLAPPNPAFDNSRDPERPLRVGYVSPDFRAHSVAFFLEPLLAHHDPAAVDVFCYADVHRPDAVTARLQSLARTWRDTTALSDDQLAAQIRADRIDILVDLAGHTVGNRLLAFARKPAPVQFTWLGYPNTTGMAAIDFRLTDARADPPGSSDSLNTEKLLRLPDTFLCFLPPADAPPVSPLPALANNHITFGCFNASSKINAPLLDLWARILRALPNSRLLLKARYLGAAENRRRIAHALSAAGVAPDRLQLLEHTRSIHEHLAAYHRVDIALDTFPYHGTTTTCEALWMGVPVISLAGQTHASRVGVSLLTSVGQTDCTAASEDDYLTRAGLLAADLPTLAARRQSLRPAMAASPLTDAPRFAKNVEAAFRSAWRASCQT